MKSELFQIDKETEWTDLGKGVRRKIAVHDDTLMLVKVRFETGAVGELHSHLHTQISYVRAGVFKYTIGDVAQIIKKGDSCIIPSNTLHGCECLEAGELIDSFTPPRADFLTL
ncbi:cupin domain-containing protein [Sphingobacterium sp. SGG-5]|uniref:cupin domain-containing protein n=1 Tax=Sphingobacterium sp. SGG-5 TaxID=2710881 RepID=UPI0013ED387C|nr:cupin domain-containing protein [Sphingobacterium sp. SGG-5]NGM62996.1 cupin domain-containing protein [Sphingobacterium sp. SGG-5]